MAALCIAAFLLAILVTREVELGNPGITHPPADPFSPLRISKLDLHEEVGPSTLETALRIAELAGVDTLVNLAGGADGGRLEAQLAAARPHGTRVILFANLDFQGCCGEPWVSREVSRLARARALGVRGLAILEVPAGTDLLSRQGDPIWSACAALGWPVVLGEIGSLEERLRVVERHPQVAFVAARGTGPDDADRVLDAMDRHGNLWLDMAGRLSGLGEATRLSRSALLAHSQRVLFGSGLKYVAAPPAPGIVFAAGSPVLLDPALLRGRAGWLFFEATLRFLETRDARISPQVPGQPRDELDGIGLPVEVLRRIYRRNAERLLGLTDPGGP